MEVFHIELKDKHSNIKFNIQIKLKEKGIVLKLLNSLAHSAPLAKIKYNKGVFYIPAFNGMIEGQKINFGKTEENKDGDILKLRDIPVKTQIYSIEAVLEMEEYS